jgi:hypothetical protein
MATFEVLLTSCYDENTVSDQANTLSMQSLDPLVRKTNTTSYLNRLFALQSKIMDKCIAKTACGGK